MTVKRPICFFGYFSKAFLPYSGGRTKNFSLWKRKTVLEISNRREKMFIVFLDDFKNKVFFLLSTGGAGGDNGHFIKYSTCMTPLHVNHNYHSVIYILKEFWTYVIQ